MKFLQPVLLIALLSAAFCSRAQISGVHNIPNATYPDLATIIAALNTQGVGTGGVIVNLAPGNPQTAPAGGYLLGSATLNPTTSASKTIVINGNNNVVTAQAGTSTAVDGIFKILGTDYVTINALNLQENAGNTNATLCMEWGYALLNLNGAAPFDGCQHDTIKNCSITLNRTIATASSAIYSGHHTALSTAALTLSADADLHKFNSFYANAITNVTRGIYLNGWTAAPAPYTLFDQDNDVGGSSAATGNTVTNCIGTNYTGIGAITCVGQNNCNISYNTVNNLSNGGANAIGACWGIYGWGPNAAFTISNNSVTIGSAAINSTYFVYGIYSNSLATNITAADNTINLTGASGIAVPNYGIFVPNGFNNTVTGNTIEQTQNTANSATYGIYSTATGTLNLNNNNIKQTATSIAAAGQFYSIVSAGVSVQENIQNNVFHTINISQGGSSILIFVYTVNTTANKNISGNSTSGTITHNSTGAAYLIYNTAAATGAGSAIISNNNFSNIIKNNTGTLYGIYYGPTAATPQTYTISGNTISGISSTGTAQLTGIYYSSGAGVNVSANIVSGLSSSGSVFGIYNAGTANVTSDILKNKIYGLTTNGGATGVFALTVAGGITNNVANNIIGDLSAGNTSGAGDLVRGISLLSTTASSSINVYYNTVYLNASSAGANFSTSGIYHTASAAATTASLDLRNNIIVNSSVPSGTGITAAFRRSSASLANFAATSDNNLLYAGTPSGSSVIMYDGTNSYQSLANYQAAVAPAETAAKTENPPFASVVGANANFLHFNPGSNTQVESGGANIAGYTDDFDGNIRQGNPGYTGNGTAPDIGADEFQNCDLVTITAQPQNAGICDGANASFSVTATNGNDFQWQVNTGSGFTNITNGGVYAGATTSTLTITNPGPGMNGYEYRVLAGFGGSCGTVASVQATLTVNPLPSASVTASGSLIFCTGSSVTLCVPAGANLTYQWMNGAANISGETNDCYTAASTGNYSVVITNTVTGCTATSGISAVVVGTGPVAAITPSGSAGVCPGGSVSLSAGNAVGVTYEWYFNGSLIAGANASTYPASAAGNYVVRVYSSPTCYTNSAPTVVFLHPLPTATAAADNNATVICPGSTVNICANTGAGLAYQWYVNNTVIAGATNACHPAATGGDFTVQVTNTLTGCINTSAPVTLTMVSLPPADISPAAPSVACDSLIMTASQGPGLTYQWLQNGQPIPGETNGTFVARVTADYSVQVTNVNNCSKTSGQVSVTINPSPISTITYGSPLVFCEGGAVALNAFAAAGLTYQWQLNGAPMPGVTDVQYVASTGGNYSVLVTNSFGCTKASPVVQVVVGPLPQPVITRSGNVLSTGSYMEYQWFLNNQAIPGATNQTLVITQNGGYRVHVKDANNCVNNAPTVIVNNTGIASVSKNEVRVFPNPASDVLYVEAPVRVNVSIRDLQGRNVLVALDARQIDLSPLASGIYMVLVTDEAGTLIGKEKLLKTD